MFREIITECFLQRGVRLNPRCGSLLSKGIVIFISINVVFLCADFRQFYNKGVLKLNPDPEFGKNTDWESLFYDTKKKMVIAPDGSFFVSNTNQHTIMKFDSKGNRTKTFMQKGAGPSDGYYPGDLSILDGKYLVIGEYAETRRISIFDLNGNFVKVVKVSTPPFVSLGLKNNKIAILTKKLLDKDRNENIVIIKDITTGEEKKIASFFTNRRIINVGPMIYSPGNFEGSVYLEKTNEGNLVVGFSSSNQISIYTPDGKIIRSIDLGFKPVAVTGDMIDEYKKYRVQSLKNDRFDSETIKRIEKASFESIMPDNLPYYCNLIVLPDNTLWVVEFANMEIAANNRVRVYSLDGREIGKMVIDFGVYKTNIYSSISFFKGSLYGLFEKKDSEDIDLRIVKVNL